MRYAGAAGILPPLLASVRVAVTEATQMVAALREQGNTVWYMNALNEGHGYRKKENRDIYQQATVLFLQKYLVGKE
ncbi:MAG: S9 family peptidase [Gammaproteobacteria bacterium]|jgi:dipeptidyl aminopeptidase/acylaminoacyl peptidase|nr:S9 family peptidase [Gammaproteobacteria bacterium]MDH3756362.1 S9 family peptidase [Gammaproteobacteria bacterium]MDH3846433.1 S9 family peptidase [Gammaproteobacteria bacterium]MDH4003820.1 S9 family peptidase [Gammaproteobacteria bacterium]